jgi:hypothetical protein
LNTNGGAVADPTDPIDELLYLAERSFIRMEAKDLIEQCLDQYDISLFNDLLERLVRAGSSSLSVLREIMDEVRATKSALGSENIGARQDLMEALTHFGVELQDALPKDVSEAVMLITSQQCRSPAFRPGRQLPFEDEQLLREICVHASEQAARIARQLGLLSQIEDAVQDWFNGLAYQAAHERDLQNGAVQPLWH